MLVERSLRIAGLIRAAGWSNRLEPVCAHKDEYLAEQRRRSAAHE
jgi:hypothetical protein